MCVWCRGREDGGAEGSNGRINSEGLLEKFKIEMWEFIPGNKQGTQAD
jgi:hypothetical protein